MSSLEANPSSTPVTKVKTSALVLVWAAIIIAVFGFIFAGMYWFTPEGQNWLYASLGAAALAFASLAFSLFGPLSYNTEK